MKFTEQPTNPVTKTTLADILRGNCCQVKDTKKIFMKVKPTGFLLNSNVVADVLNRGDCFVVDLTSGTLYAHTSTTEVTPLDVSANYTKTIL